MQLTIESVGPSKSGKALRVKANGQWYGAKKDSGIEKGMVIDAETEDGEFGLWINKYKKMGNGTAPASNGGDHTGLTEPELRFISNVVGTAIEAKTIDDPAQISVWAKAARATLKELA